MNCTRTFATPVLDKHAAAYALRAINGRGLATSASRPTFIALQAQSREPRRHFSNGKTQHFSNSSNLKIKEFFPAPDAPSIRTTEAAWHHPIYTEQQMKEVQVAHRDAKTWSDKVALTMVKLLRWGLDRATGYVHKDAKELAAMGLTEEAKKKYRMTEKKYMIRNIFLESVAGKLATTTAGVENCC